ncbi:GGDEF domain-containing protein [Algisphaera agarilytica]|uniref:diguanylate cyclase n=1 Tax=Algisphaera agarilytica TaxID=1385975 RepID=A0A7X0H7Q4_9BACT|nr:GGDEF domain-containing protein [Algisphaera agarilytica]MBB6429651.1 diguanylate cyclase (GGDEF)-like protein [Algisphaera agarilytica]
MVETIADNPHPQGSRAEAKLDRAHRRRNVLHSRLALLVVVTLGVGFGLGQLQFVNDLSTLAVALGMLIAGSLALWFAWSVIARPITRLADQLDSLTLDQRQTQIRELPTDRADEVGRMARAVRTLAVSRIRDYYDARQLRRTLDDRVTTATKKAVSTLSKLAMRDALTELGNRRFLDAHLPGLIEASRESDTDLLCVMIDMDNFKQVNDNLGHNKGDELLVLLADLIRSSIRHHEDLAIRLGGDEFVLFLPGASLKRAAELTQHIRTLYRQQATSLLGPGFQIDLSVGAASLQDEGCRDGEELMEQADQHLYQAKRAGKGITWTMHGQAAA